MVETRGREFFTKVHPVLSNNVASQNDFQIMRSPRMKPLSRPVCITAAWLARMPTNLSIIHFFLKLLKALGQVPFCYDAKNCAYYFTWLSLDTAISMVVSCTTIFGWFVFISHMVFQKFLVFGPGIRCTRNAVEKTLKSNNEMSEHQIEANIQALAIMDACISLSQFAHIISGWKNRQKLIAIMNRWTRILQSLETFLYSTQRYTPAETGWYYSSIAFGTAFVLVTTTGTALLSIGAPSCPDQVIEAAFMYLIFFYYRISEALQDSLVNLMFYELSRSMKQVRQQILLDIERGNIPGETVRTWRQIVLFIRQQTDGVAEHISMPQLSLLLQSLLLGTTAMFIALVNGYGIDSAGVQSASLSLFVWVLARLLLKAYMAEKITAEEALLADELLGRNIKGSSSTVMAEVRDLRNLLLSRPVKINLGNIVVLRRKLCLTVISQIVTYVIVLIQFYNEK